MSSRRRLLKRAIHLCLLSRSAGGIGLGFERRGCMPPRSRDKPTIPDLVVLSFLADRPMHGYELNQELIRCEVEDWAGISRPQVYYSLRKLENRRWIQETTPERPSGGPQQQVYAITRQGRAALSTALNDKAWATKRPPPPFLTWLALAHHATSAVRERALARRRSFLRQQIQKECATLKAIRDDPTVTTEIPALMVRFAIQQFELELSWLNEVEVAVCKL
jgi:DNA-binding PadR family transcriptional regulator